jgi:hypothetical protein
MNALAAARGLHWLGKAAAGGHTQAQLELARRHLGLLGGDESDVDCGGACGDCGDGSNCQQDGDCASGVCDGGDGTCVAPACDDGVKNGDETGADCGGSTCDPCGQGLPCSTGSDCESGACVGQDPDKSCSQLMCGDGGLGLGETCDDSNAFDLDGCAG